MYTVRQLNIVYLINISVQSPENQSVHQHAVILYLCQYLLFIT